MEIVSNLMHSAEDAIAYMTAIKQIMQYGDISSCDQEKGQMRSDVNISVRPVGQKTLGSKVEIKNMNSFSFIEEAIEYEIERQITVLRTVVQLTKKLEVMIRIKGKHLSKELKKMRMIIVIFQNLIYYL